MKVNSLLKNYGKFFPLLVCQFSSCFGDSFLRALFILLITFRVDISETAGAIMVFIGNGFVHGAFFLYFFK